MDSNIDDALAQIDRLVDEGHAGYASVGVALAAEVRRLREENRLLEDRVMSYARDNNTNLEKLARVEALTAKWRATTLYSRAWDCAVELEAALRG